MYIELSGVMSVLTNKIIAIYRWLVIETGMQENKNAAKASELLYYSIGVSIKSFFSKSIVIRNDLKANKPSL